jgi:hypothetical protein
MEGFGTVRAFGKLYETIDDDDKVNELGAQTDASFQCWHGT